MAQKKDNEAVLMVKDTPEGEIKQYFNPNMFRYLKEIKPGLFEGGWRKATAIPILPEVEQYFEQNKKKEDAILVAENETLKQRISELETEIIVLQKQIAEVKHCNCNAEPDTPKKPPAKRAKRKPPAKK